LLNIIYDPAKKILKLSETFLKSPTCNIVVFFKALPEYRSNKLGRKKGERKNGRERENEDS
jgi:hypothetical protein